MNNDVQNMLDDLLQHLRAGNEVMLFDLETTGFSPQKDRILSFSAIKATFDKVTGKFIEQKRIDQYINPERSIPADATKTHGITYDMVKDKPTAEEAAFIIAPFIGSHPYVIGQNVSFDIRHMQAMASRCQFVFEPENVCDTLTIAKKMVGPRTPNHKLETLANFFQIDKTGLRAHESISDVIMTMRILEKMIAVYQDKLDIDSLVEPFKKKLEEDAKFEPVPANMDVPFKPTEREIPDDGRPLFKPNIASLSEWKKYSMHRIYANTYNKGVKVWFDLKTRVWEFSFDKNEESLKAYRGVDLAYVKDIAGRMVRMEQYKDIYNILVSTRNGGNE